MPHGARKGAWHFDTMWTLPANMIGSTSFADRCCALDELESAFIRDVVERTTFPMYTINVEIKYKLADLEDAFNNPPNQLQIPQINCKVPKVRQWGEESFEGCSSRCTL